MQRGQRVGLHSVVVLLSAYNTARETRQQWGWGSRAYTGEGLK